MSDLIRGVAIVIGVALFVGVSAASESFMHGYGKEGGIYRPVGVKAGSDRTTGAAPEKSERWSKGRVYPEPVTERTRDVLRAKRPK